MIFNNDTVLDVLKHEVKDHYHLQMKSGEDVLVNIDDMIDELFALKYIKVEQCGKSVAVLYNKQSFESDAELRTEITNEDVFELLNKGLVSFTEVEQVKESTQKE